jgi:AcrR family transcriptional regulator
MGRKSLAKERRAQILDAFYRCIKKYGLHGASTRRIAEEAGVQPSILHHYFKDRDEMIEELVANIVDNISVRYLVEIDRHKNPATRFNRAVEFLFGPEMINGDDFGFFYDCWAEAQRNEKVRRSFTKLYHSFRAGIIRLLARTNKSTGMSPAQTKELATMVVAIQDGVSVQWDMDRKNVNLKKMAHMTKQFIELYIEANSRKKGNEKADTKTGRRSS